MTQAAANSSHYMTTTIDLLRHGECEGGACYRGKLTDHSLTSKGLQQMADKIEKHKVAWDRIIASPLKRCAFFANELSATQDIPLEFNDDLKEISFGQWDGQLTEDVWIAQAHNVELWFKDPVRHPPPGGEAADAFSNRVVSVCESLVQKYAGEKIVMICHGGVMRALLGYCLSMRHECLSRFDVPYACFSRIQIISDGEKNHYRLLNHNI
jgi:broad specificity phosphatase PhoE